MTPEQYVPYEMGLAPGLVWPSDSASTPMSCDGCLVTLPRILSCQWSYCPYCGRLLGLYYTTGPPQQY